MRHRTQNYGLVFSMISSVTLAALKLMGVVDWSWWVVASPMDTCRPHGGGACSRYHLYDL